MHAVFKIELEGDIYEGLVPGKDFSENFPVYLYPLNNKYSVAMLKIL